MTSPFERGTALEPRGEGRFAMVIPDGWQQGRGAFGGLVVGALARAMLGSEPDAERSLRTITADLCGPVLPGEATLEVTVLRRGKNLSNLDARFLQQGQIQARASAVLSVARAVESPSVSPAYPSRPSWNQVEVAPVGPPMGPVFAQHFEYRPTGPWPFAGGAEAVASGYLRERIPPAVLDAPAVLGLLDAWWAALFAIETRPRAIATVSFTAELVEPPASLPSDEPLFHTARVVAQRDGYSTEFRELWWGQKLVALNQQTFVVLK